MEFYFFGQNELTLDFWTFFNHCFLYIAEEENPTNVFGEIGVDKLDNNNNKKKTKEAAEYNWNSFVMSSRRAFDNNL